MLSVGGVLYGTLQAHLRVEGTGVKFNACTVLSSRKIICELKVRALNLTALSSTRKSRLMLPIIAFKHQDRHKILFDLNEANVVWRKCIWNAFEFMQFHFRQQSYHAGRY